MSKRRLGVVQTAYKAGETAAETGIDINLAALASTALQVLKGGVSCQKHG